MQPCNNVCIFLKKARAEQQWEKGMLRSSLAYLSYLASGGDSSTMLHAKKILSIKQVFRQQNPRTSFKPCLFKS